MTLKTPFVRSALAVVAAGALLFAGASGAQAATLSLVGTASVTPSSGLVDDQTVAVSASGFTDGGSGAIRAAVCDEDAWVNNAEARCYIAAGYFAASSAGATSLTGTLKVKESFSGSHAGAPYTVDCAVDNCAVVFFRHDPASSTYSYNLQSIDF
ncbi:neocarzinostatin apoprotein domain-containing protein [Leucobacter japonicus]|uniref:neocarzinostatin apoprotein domain-containing protein n=1 Tax=Leucobacter japonicus TaxID=1461259 RepID=UPI0006A784BB|nr:neocarzinostatin apoprotein domain-containing protein [Leucobacter japonicus]